MAQIKPTEIEVGATYRLTTSGDSTVRVEALSKQWENSKGICGFDARLLEDFGSSKAGDRKCMQLHIYDVHPLEFVQCEQCGDEVPEREARMKSVPGATLAFCESCSAPSRAEELGLMQ